MTSPARLQSLDLVRGVAVMGILLLNIVSFAMPEAAYMNPRAYGGWQGADLGVYLVNFVLFDGKMRGLFSFLFGASLLLVVERAEASGRDPARTHYFRMIWLLAFGVAHLLLVWHGDILTLYALTGMVAFAARKMPVERLVILGIMLACVGVVMFAGLPFMIHQLQQPAANAGEAAAQARQLRDFANGFGMPAADEIAKQLTLHRGDYATILVHRLGESARMLPASIVLFGAETLAYMLFGMAALKSGMLRGEWSTRRYAAWLAICWGIALPAYIALAVYLVHEQFSLFAVSLAVLALAAPVRPLMFTGWACLILLLARGGGALTGRIAAAGRMAFTNYLATSLICTLFFYGYGFGWYGHLSRWQLYLVVAAIWMLMLLWSKPWLAHFRFGPFEWLWRSLARGRPQAIRGPALT